MENYIVINGKKAELTPEQLKALGIEVKKPSPFDRVPVCNKFYSITATGVVGEYVELDGCGYGENAHRVANYCTNKALFQQQAYRETLNRLLWRFSMENGGDEIKFGVYRHCFKICYIHSEQAWSVSCNDDSQNLGIVYFATRKIAEQAIEEIVKPFMNDHPDFKL